MAKQQEKHMTCSTCGSGTSGRQWWNRDTGYGLCNKCAKWYRSHPEWATQEGFDSTEEYMYHLFGREGFHYGTAKSKAYEKELASTWE